MLYRRFFASTSIKREVRATFHGTLNIFSLGTLNKSWEHPVLTKIHMGCHFARSVNKLRLEKCEQSVLWIGGANGSEIGMVISLIVEKIGVGSGFRAGLPGGWLLEAFDTLDVLRHPDPSFPLFWTL
uniref:Uncharacterized protein n=1 Tax=Panagrellus redivivus TaxID=6233 RepID=A0A7E4UNJ8_PANRE